MANIIAAVDFSDCSINALEHAVGIAAKGALDVHMVWVNNPSLSKATIYSDGSSTLVEDVKKQFKGLIDKYQPMLPDSKIDYVIREGKVYRELNAEVKEMGSLCLVMGTHGISGFEQRWIGSNATKLISVAKCPVITIRAGIDPQMELRTIVLPIDSTVDTRQKVPFTAYLAMLFNAEIYVLSIYTTKNKTIVARVGEYTDQVCRYLSEEGLRYHRDVLNCENVTTATIEYAKKIRANLISIMTEQETSTYNLFIGPYAQQMVNTSPFPILSLKPIETMVMDSR